MFNEDDKFTRWLKEKLKDRIAEIAVAIPTRYFANELDNWCDFDLEKVNGVYTVSNSEKNVNRIWSILTNNDDPLHSYLKDLVTTKRDPQDVKAFYHVVLEFHLKQQTK